MKNKLVLVTVLAVVLFSMPAIGNAGCYNIAEADGTPVTLMQVSPDRWHYNYNIETVLVDRDGDGNTETIYQYCYVIIDGPVSKGKILKAIDENKKETAVGDVQQERDEALLKLKEISGLSYTDLDQYVDNTFGNLPAAQRTALKKLYKAVLAVIKMGSWGSE